jgi:hypothetical protein
MFSAYAEGKKAYAALLFGSTEVASLKVLPMSLSSLFGVTA